MSNSESAKNAAVAAALKRAREKAAAAGKDAAENSAEAPETEGSLQQLVLSRRRAQQ